jgi:hypothetical protein
VLWELRVRDPWLPDYVYVFATTPCCGICKGI